ncbi:nucleotidyltransferase family protein [Fulvivirga sediminis]|uniref:Nucleotidyltransferase family protein n=1 Tax=Fulvivirga sediminis TaxID=2803949 RepID=A0A937F9U7_9BACT|nr:nucleotidyltransferase family protein [Fulvivirga sediminis]MBL3657652.1 nucleotidyltransferase family protein [Fulvivirga sediminis]
MNKMEGSAHNIGIIILAAGASSRLGEPKQLLPYHEAPLLQHTINEANAISSFSSILVLGANAAEIKKAIDPKNFKIIFNNEWQKGMGSSLSIAMKEAASNHSLEHILILLSDQPLVNTDYFNKLIKAHITSHKSITASFYNNIAGVPAIFSKDHFNDLKKLQGDKGARQIIKNTPPQLVEFDQGQIDIDTPEDWVNFNSLKKKNPSP